MRINYHTVASTVAAVLAGAALAVSLTSHGPQGLQGPRGYAGPQGVQGVPATDSHLGFCWNMNDYMNGSDSNANDIATPALNLGGIVQCNSGEFVSVVPG